MRRALVFAIYVLLLWGTASAKFIVEKNSLKVTSPDSLKDVYECAIGNFGVPQYGGTMVGILVYPKSNAKACRNFDEFNISFKSKAGGFPTFLLVDRGGQFLSLKFCSLSLYHVACKRSNRFHFIYSDTSLSLQIINTTGCVYIKKTLQVCTVI